MEHLTKILPTYNQTTLRILDFIRQNPGAYFKDISEVLKPLGKTNASLRGHLVILLREGLIFSDLVGPIVRGHRTAEYYLTMKAERLLEENNLEYAS